MASSDNVVRAGLTPKYKDVDTLLEMLEYIPQTVEETKFTPVVDSGDLNISTYNPPVDDFIVRKVEVIKISFMQFPYLAHGIVVA